MKRVVVIGAGLGGLSAAAYLARQGLDVTVLEAHIYPGGCAGTFYHQGYRFDAGATLAGGFYRGGPMDILGRAVGIERWPAEPANPAMAVHLPNGAEIRRYADEQRWAERRAAFGAGSLDFWRWQERTADLLWALAGHLPAWPPQSPDDFNRLIQSGAAWLREGLAGELEPGLLASIIADANRPVAAHLTGQPDALRLFVDAQLLISAQAESHQANALYGAAALDLPRRGVVHLEGGMGAVAQRLAQAVRQNGGRVHYRQEAVRIRMERGRPVSVETRQGASYPADILVANLTPWNAAALLEDHLPKSLRGLPARPQKGWGAFTLYLGVDESAIQPDIPLHHQVVTARSLGEGNSVFLSISPGWDPTRAPLGKRALTLSTHTELAGWWDLFEKDPQAYAARQASYSRRLLAAAERALPGLAEAAELALPGTPVTFQRFTRRAGGWVGGFPQTSLLAARGPRLGRGLWLVGDSIFPGQSAPSAALGGLRTAAAILREQAARPGWAVQAVLPHASEQTGD